MIRRLLLCVAAVGAAAALLIQADPSEGYRAYRGATVDDNCVQCHGGFRVGSPSLHSVHVGGSQITNNCDLCHGGGTDFGDVRLGVSDASPDLSCTGCHLPGGLMAKHASAIDNDGLACADCHDPLPPAVPENTLPPYYARGDVDVSDPCRRLPANGGEDWNGDGQGLDNDGDGDYDFEDEDCAGVPTAPRSWGAVKSGYGRTP